MELVAPPDTGRAINPTASMNSGRDYNPESKGDSSPVRLTLALSRSALVPQSSKKMARALSAPTRC